MHSTSRKTIEEKLKHLDSTLNGELGVMDTHTERLVGIIRLLFMGVVGTQKQRAALIRISGQLAQGLGGQGATAEMIALRNSISMMPRNTITRPLLDQRARTLRQNINV